MQIFFETFTELGYRVCHQDERDLDHYDEHAGFEAEIGGDRHKGNSVR